ncbi:MAG TPA: class D beta-lactamase [Lunatimonas sp.]|nr:class D beta-lactamase [Lunatimonas sp.]
MQPFFIFLPSLLMVLFSCSPPSEKYIYRDFGKYYDLFEVEGTFVLYDLKKETFIVHNAEFAGKPFTPASTFKIVNSLIGLETGVISDASFIIAWDSVVRDLPIWNQDQSLSSAFKYSAVWYYQEMARRIGEDQLKTWLEKLEYGNGNISSGVDRFWLSGSLQVTPQQQVDFLKRLYANKLPVHDRSSEIVKEIMVEKDSLGYVLRSKTGWGNQDGKEVGWYVGYFETGDNDYFFANCILTEDKENRTFLAARKEIVNLIMEELDLL